MTATEGRHLRASAVVIEEPVLRALDADFGVPVEYFAAGFDGGSGRLRFWGEGAVDGDDLSVGVSGVEESIATIAAGAPSSLLIVGPAEVRNRNALS